MLVSMEATELRACLIRHLNPDEPMFSENGFRLRIVEELPVFAGYSKMSADGG